jgi:hypothetical protein
MATKLDQDFVAHIKKSHANSLAGVNALVSEVERLEGQVTAFEADMKVLRPECEACRNPAVVQYDSNGEGCYWLCARTDGDHDESHYCGTETARLQS